MFNKIIMLKKIQQVGSRAMMSCNRWYSGIASSTGAWSFCISACMGHFRPSTCLQLYIRIVELNPARSTATAPAPEISGMWSWNWPFSSFSWMIGSISVAAQSLRLREYAVMNWS